jgi:hypothetical protein
MRIRSLWGECDMKQAVAWTGAVVILAGVLATSAGAQGQPPAAVSADKAKELVTLMAAQKLESFAAKDGEDTLRFVAVLVVPNVQLLMVSCKYTRDNDIEYALYHKQYQNAYQDLRSGVFGSDRFIVDDAQMNGLVALPGKNPQYDAVTIDAAKVVFDGMFGDGKGRNAKKPLTDVYMKSFADADARYARLLDILIAQLKAGKVLAAPSAMR